MEIPGFLVSASAGKSLVDRATRGDLRIRFAEQPGMTEAWLELGLTTWPAADKDFNVVFRQLIQKNAASDERVRWLNAKRSERFSGDATTEPAAVPTPTVHAAREEL